MINNKETFKIQIDNYFVRREEHQGIRYVIVPVIMMVEGVHNGSHGPLLHLAEDLGRFPEAWNGIPIMINHPEDDGRPVSANSPDILEFSVGRIFNTHMDGLKLKAEMWLKEEKLKQISPETLDYINKGSLLEVSVGIFTDEEKIPGEWNGEHYESISRNHRPDHCAILAPGIDIVGACSIEDGCGVRANKKGGKDVKTNEAFTINALRYSGTESTAWTAPTLSDFDVDGNWDSLSATDKAKVASHYLIGSSTAETFGDLKLPVVNPRTGKLSERALRAVIGGRGAQVGGVSAEQRSAARRRAYRLLNSEFDAELEIPENLQELKLINLDWLYANADQGYKQLIETTQRQLDSMDNGSRLHFLEEMYDDYFIYSVQEQNSNVKPRYFKQSYKVLENDSIDFIDQPVEARKETEYVTLSQIEINKEKEGKMTKKTDGKEPCCEDLVNELIANERTKFAEEDRETLLAMEEDFLKKLIPEKEKQQQELPLVNAEKAMEVLKETIKKPEDFIKLLPEEMRDSLNSGLKLHETKKAGMIDEILENTDETWSKEELEKKDFETLEKIYKSIPKEADYSMLGDSGRPVTQEGVEPLYPVEVEFDDKK